MLSDIVSHPTFVTEELEREKSVIEQEIGARLLAMHPNVVDAGLFDRYIDVVERGQPFELCDWGYPQEVLGGTWRYYDVHAVAANGCVSQLWTDVTERHLAVEQLHESERRYRLLAENASEVVFEGNNEGFLQWISPPNKRTRKPV